MDILVTGAAGFIGSHACEALVARGHRVVGLDAFDDFLYPAPPKRDNARRLAATLDPARYRLIEGDICDPAAVAGAVGDVDAVLHLAALAGVQPSLRDPRRYIDTNLGGTTVLLEACRRAGVARLVFGSSSSVYGSRGPVAGAGGTGSGGAVAAFREDDPCLRPASPYAATKRAGELVCSTFRDLYGVGVLSLRFFTVYGPRQRPDMAIHRFVRAIARGEPITLYGDGTSRRDYTFVADIVSGVVAACERVEPGLFEIYNLGSTDTTSLHELVRAIERVVGKDAIVRRAPDRPGDVPITFADIARARRDLGYEPRVALASGLEAFWRWYRETIHPGHPGAADADAGTGDADVP